MCESVFDSIRRWERKRERRKGRWRDARGCERPWTRGILCMAPQECHPALLFSRRSGPAFLWRSMQLRSCPLLFSLNLSLFVYQFLSVFFRFLYSLPVSLSFPLFIALLLFLFFAYSIAPTISRVIRITEFDRLLTRRDLSENNEGKQLFFYRKHVCGHENTSQQNYH